MKIRTFFSLLLFGFCLLLGTAKANNLENWDITFKINGIQAGDTCLLAYYRGDKNFIKDTIFAEKGGLLRYKSAPGDEALDAGIYLMVLPGMVHFDFIFVEPKFTLETDTKDLIENMKVKGSRENTLFFDYKRYVESRQKKLAELNKAPEKNKEEMLKLNDEVMNYRNDFVTKNANTFIAKVFNATRDPEIPQDGPKDEKGQVDKTYQYQYYKQHFLDGIDFSDRRLIQTPVFQARIKDYLNRITVQSPDSIIASIDEIIEKAEADEMVKKFCIITAMGMYAGSKQMCFDKIYVHIAGKYYVSGVATWIDSTQLSKIKDRYYKMMYNNCGERAVNLKMQDVNGNPQQLYAVDADYTVVVFWAHDCGHCKKEMPKLGEFYEEYKKHKVEVFAVSTKDELDKWQEFIKDKALPDWINVADPEHKTNFRIFYDIYSTPVIYLLDADKNIIGKRLDVENLKLFLNHELGIEAEEKEKP